MVVLNDTLDQIDLTDYSEHSIQKQWITYFLKYTWKSLQNKSHVRPRLFNYNAVKLKINLKKNPGKNINI